MAFENKAFVGRDVAVQIALVAETTEPEEAAFDDVGAVRGLEYGPEWDTVDTTARGTSAGFSRSNLVTYKSNNLSIDGLRLLDGQIQDDIEDHIDNPPEAMNYQPYAWIKLIIPKDAGATQTRSFPVILSSFRPSAPYDGEATWSMEAMGQGDPVVTDVPAV